MDQPTSCFSRVFSLEENEKALDMLTEMQNVFCRKILSGEPIILSEGQCRHVVIGFGKNSEVATIHYLVKDGKVRFMSVVIAATPLLTRYLSQPFLGSQFSSGLPILPEEFWDFAYASGWHDLVSCEADEHTVRAGMDSSRTRPAVGGTANQ